MSYALTIDNLLLLLHTHMVYMHRSLFNVMYLIAFCNPPLLHHCYITHFVTSIAVRQQAIGWYLLLMVQIANRLKVLDGFLRIPRYSLSHCNNTPLTSRTSLLRRLRN